MDSDKKAEILHFIYRFGIKDIQSVLDGLHYGVQDEEEDPRETVEPVRRQRKQKRGLRRRTGRGESTMQDEDIKVLSVISETPGATRAEIETQLKGQVSPEDIVKAVKRLAFRGTIKSKHIEGSKFVGYHPHK